VGGERRRRKHVCLRKVDAVGINAGIHQEGVTHFCAAPTV